MFFYRNTHRVLVQMGSWWCLTVRRVSANAAVIQIWYIIHIRYLQIPAGRSKTGKVYPIIFSTYVAVPWMARIASWIYVQWLCCASWWRSHDWPLETRAREINRQSGHDLSSFLLLTSLISFLLKHIKNNSFDKFYITECLAGICL